MLQYLLCIASHSVLQYLLPSLAIQLHDGCAHFVFFAAIIPPAKTLLRLILGVVLVRTLPFALHTDFVFDVVRTSKLNRFGGNCVLFLVGAHRASQGDGAVFCDDLDVVSADGQ